MSACKMTFQNTVLAVCFIAVARNPGRNVSEVSRLGCSAAADKNDLLENLTVFRVLVSSLWQQAMMPVYVDNGLWIPDSMLLRPVLGDYAEQMVEILETFENVNFCHSDFVQNEQH